MLLTESQVVSALSWAGVRESIRTLVIIGRLVRVNNRYGVHYRECDVNAITGATAPERQAYTRATVRDCECCGQHTMNDLECDGCALDDCDPSTAWHCFTDYCDGSGCTYMGECEPAAEMAIA